MDRERIQRQNDVGPSSHSGSPDESGMSQRRDYRGQSRESDNQLVEHLGEISQLYKPQDVVNIGAQ
jgi:hypothetical protein